MLIATELRLRLALPGQQARHDYAYMGVSKKWYENRGKLAVLY